MRYINSCSCKFWSKNASFGTLKYWTVRNSVSLRPLLRPESPVNSDCQPRAMFFTVLLTTLRSCHACEYRSLYSYLMYSSFTGHTNIGPPFPVM